MKLKAVYYFSVMSMFMSPIALGMDESDLKPTVQRPNLSVEENYYLDALELWQDQDFNNIFNTPSPTLEDLRNTIDTSDRERVLMVLELMTIRLAALFKLNMIDELSLVAMKKLIKDYQSEINKVKPDVFNHFIDAFNSFYDVIFDGYAEPMKVPVYFKQENAKSVPLVNSYVRRMLSSLSKYHQSCIADKDNSSQSSKLRIALLTTISIDFGISWVCDSAAMKYSSENSKQLADDIHYGLRAIAAIANEINEASLDKEFLRTAKALVEFGKPIQPTNPFNLVAKLCERFDEQKLKPIFSHIKLIPLNRTLNNNEKALVLTELNWEIIRFHDDVPGFQKFYRMAKLLGEKNKQWSETWQPALASLVASSLSNCVDLLKNSAIRISVAYYLYQIPEVAKDVDKYLENTILPLEFIRQAPVINMVLDREHNFYLKEICARLRTQLLNSVAQRDDAASVAEGLQFNEAYFAYRERDYREAFRIASTTNVIKRTNTNARGKARGGRGGRGGGRAKAATQVTTAMSEKIFAQQNYLLFVLAASALKLKESSAMEIALQKIEERSISSVKMSEEDEATLLLFRLLIEDKLEDIEPLFKRYRQYIIDMPLGFLATAFEIACDRLEDEMLESELFFAVLLGSIKNYEPESSMAEQIGTVSRARSAKANKRKDRMLEDTPSPSLPMLPSFDTAADSTVDENVTEEPASEDFSSPFEVSGNGNLKSNYRDIQPSKAQQKRDARNAKHRDEEEPKPCKPEASRAPVKQFSEEIIKTLEGNDIVTKVLRGEKKGITVGDLIQIASKAGATIKPAKGSHTKAATTNESPIMFAFHKQAKKYQINFLKQWLFDRGMPMPKK